MAGIVFVQNPLRLAQELGFSGIRPDRARAANDMGPPLSAEQEASHRERVKGVHVHELQKARRRRKSKRAFA